MAYRFLIDTYKPEASHKQERCWTPDNHLRSNMLVITTLYTKTPPTPTAAKRFRSNMLVITTLYTLRGGCSLHTAHYAVAMPHTICVASPSRRDS